MNGVSCETIDLLAVLLTRVAAFESQAQHCPAHDATIDMSPEIGFQPAQADLLDPACLLDEASSQL